MKYLIIDYETRSEAPLKEIGAYEYASHPTTELMCVAWRHATREELAVAPTMSWSPAKASPIGGLIAALTDPDTVCVAHNALFEQVITRFVLGGKLFYRNKALAEIPTSRWICTASLAAALALPRALEGACNALGLKVQKDTEGRRLMLKYTKPRKATKHNDAKWHADPEELARILLYCENDIKAETELFLRLPPLNETERKLWELDQKINLRGFAVDRPLVEATLKMIAEETEVLHEETHQLSGGKIRSVKQVGAMQTWLKDNGLFLPDMQAKTIADALKSGLAKGHAKRMLEIRQSISKTSTAKYEGFEMRSRSDSRVRDSILYHGASTGRWAGAGIQPQNFPRGAIRDSVEACEILRAGELEFVRMVYGDPMNAFASCLRSVIVAPEGKELFCADYAAIEARVLFWMADHADGVTAFRDNRPMYEEMAAYIFGIDVKDVTKVQRQLGKGAVLGAGYQMGWKKFQATCKSTGLDISEDLSKKAIQSYRSKHHPVVKLWRKLEEAAITAVLNPGRKYSINHTKWFMRKSFLHCELPSGRLLSYPNASVKYEPPRFGEGEMRPVLYSWCVNPKTRQWEESGNYGGLLTENTVSAIARDLMAEAMLRIEDAGYEITMTVHDELVAERDEFEGSLKEFEDLMAAVPPWAEGCPVRVEGWQGYRYKK